MGMGGWERGKGGHRVPVSPKLPKPFPIPYVKRDEFGKRELPGLPWFPLPGKGAAGFGKSREKNGGLGFSSPLWWGRTG